METLQPNEEGFTHLLLALVRTRSIAAEGGYLDLMAGYDFLPGIEPWTANPKTVELLADLQSGKRECTPMLWANLAYIVDTSPGWALGLRLRGVQMPDRSAAIAAMAKEN